jgi:hypothetical protein
MTQYKRTKPMPQFVPLRPSIAGEIESEHTRAEGRANALQRLDDAVLALEGATNALGAAWSDFVSAAAANALTLCAPAPSFLFASSSSASINPSVADAMYPTAVVATAVSKASPATAAAFGGGPLSGGTELLTQRDRDHALDIEAAAAVTELVRVTRAHSDNIGGSSTLFTAMTQSSRLALLEGLNAVEYTGRLMELRTRAFAPDLSERIRQVGSAPRIVIKERNAIRYYLETTAARLLPGEINSSKREILHKLHTLLVLHLSASRQLATGAVRLNHAHGGSASPSVARAASVAAGGAPAAAATTRGGGARTGDNGTYLKRSIVEL